MRKSLKRDVLLYGGADILFRLAQFVVIPFYAHVFTVADFGTLALLQVTAALVGLFINLGVNNAVQRFYFEPHADGGRRRLLVTTGLFQLAGSGVVVVAVGLVAGWAFSAEIDRSYGIGWILVATALLSVLPEQVAQFAIDATRLQFAPLKFCVLSCVKNFLGILLGVYLLRWGLGIEAILLGALIANVLAVPTGLVLIRNDLGWRFDRAVAAEVFHYGYPFVLASAAYWVFGSMDRWMLVKMSDLTEVGLFSTAMKFAGILTFVISAFAQAWSPHAMRMRSEDPDYRRSFARIFSLWFFVLALSAFSLALSAPEILHLLTPRAYWPAAPALSVAAAGLAFYGTVQLTVLGISFERRTILITCGAWAAAIVNVLSNLLLIPTFGAFGAALSSLLAYATLTGAFLFWSQRLHPIPLEKAKLAYCLAVVILGTSASLALNLFGIGPITIAVKGVLLAAAILGAVRVGILDARSRTIIGVLFPMRRMGVQPATDRPSR